MKAFLGKHLIKCKIFVDKKILNVKYFKYLACEISCDKGNKLNKLVFFLKYWSKNFQE